ncbi:MAG: AI-2E family transporter, partial [Balneolaceae bacterium]
AYLSLVRVPQWTEGMTAGAGWIALAIVVFASWKPERLVLGAYLFGGVTVLQLNLQAAGSTIPLASLPAIACILAIFVVQMLDNIVFQPMLFSRSADMHPVAILFIILIGAETAGILGMLIAIPIATIIKITITQVSWSFNNYQIFRRDLAKTNSPPG